MESHDSPLYEDAWGRQNACDEWTVADVAARLGGQFRAFSLSADFHADSKSVCRLTHATLMPKSGVHR